ncbi:ATP-binding protein [Shimia sp. W99]
MWRISGALIATGLGALAMAAILGQGSVRDVFLLVGSVLGFLLMGTTGARGWARWRRARDVASFRTMMLHDPEARWLSTASGDILYANPKAITLFGALPDVPNMRLLFDHLLVGRGDVVSDLLQDSCSHEFTEQKFSLQNNILRVTVYPIERSLFCWSMTTEKLRSDHGGEGELAQVPALSVKATGDILFMNTAARALLGEEKTHVSQVLSDAALDQADTRTVMTAGGERQCLVGAFDQAEGRRSIYLLPTEVPTVQKGVIQFDELPVALLKVRRDGRVEMANRAARRLIHMEIDSETNVGDLMEGLGRSIRDWLNEAAAGYGSNHSEFLRLKRGDREVFVQVGLNRVVEGDTSSLIAVLSDATELKTLEAQFVQSQKMQAIGQLAGGVAHDFNNLLTAISGHCDLLLLRHDQGDPDFGDLVQINQNANRAAALVGQLLAFSRKQNLRPEVLDLRNTLSDLTHLLNRLVGERVSLILSNDPELPTIRADKRQLEQVLMNLVVNARDAMPSGGEIRILTEKLVLSMPLERDRVTVPKGEYVSVRVADDGTGIAPDKLQKVFEPFYTTKRTGEGTGLGLSTAYGIVKQTGGYIFVDSTIGIGTTFTLLFPVHEFSGSEVAAPPAERPEPNAYSAQKDGVVLLVEDEAPVRSFASRALRLRGFTVLEAGSGEEALELLENEAPVVDLFVTDVIMPGLDGPGWVRKARRDYPQTPVIFVSGYAEDSFSDDQSQIENSSFLPKPFSLSDLTKAVQEQVGLVQETLS